MAETICRTLRDGALEGEHALALTIKDTTAPPFGLHVFTHVLSQLSSFVLAGKSQSKAIVVLSFSRSPSFYVDLLKNRGIDISSSSQKWIQILDCYTDPLGWKDQQQQEKQFDECGTAALEDLGVARVCKDVKDLDKLYSLIIEMGKGLVGQGKARFSVAVDSISEMLRRSPISKVAGLLSNLRSHDQISSLLWLLHSDLHEIRVTSAVEYISSMLASVEPVKLSGNEQGDLANFSLLELNFQKGKLTVRLKRRNGRVRIMYEEFQIHQSGITFTSISSEGDVVNQLLPKVQFNLQLSEKERIERANVVLPFEHQGNDKPLQIYDGRRALTGDKNPMADNSSGNAEKNQESAEGEIIYFRDSDDEMPDSDEDPDDDLDI